MQMNLVMFHTCNCINKCRKVMDRKVISFHNCTYAINLNTSPSYCSHNWTTMPTTASMSSISLYSATQITYLI